MAALDKHEREILEYLVRNREEPAEVRQGAKVRALVMYVIGAAMILAASQFIQPNELSRWIWLGLATLGGVLITAGAMLEPLRKQYEVLQEFVDFDQVQARLGSAREQP